MTQTGTRTAKFVAREKYAWPGGYALALVMADGEMLCPGCIRTSWREIVQAHLWADNRGDPAWTPIGVMHSGESDEELQCAHCSNAII